MEYPQQNKYKILNDPVYGFITLRHSILLDIIDHPYFQRLRRISQLGLSHLVYPGALHNRYHHAIGAMYLMQHAIDQIRQKGHDITHEESRAVCMAILLHDVGHGPFSHALEHSIVNGISHEDISVFIMNRLNDQFNGLLDMSIEIFNDHYPKPFLHQLVSSQLDMDRLDYLKRDSFYTGVTEGQVGSERLIKMLNVDNGDLVIEEKGIYSVEKFIVARRLMYWQVYLHKTVLAAEFMLVNALKRAKELVHAGEQIFASPALNFFLKNEVQKEDFMADPEVLDKFCSLDDFDIYGALKVWATNDDPVLSKLSSGLVDRKLFRIVLRNEPFTDETYQRCVETVAKHHNMSTDDARYFVIRESIDNKAYNQAAGIPIKFKDGRVMDAADASDHLNLTTLSKAVEKHFICFPKDVDFKI